MIPALIESLKTWIIDTLGDVAVVMDPPGDVAEHRTVSLYLRKIGNSPATGPVLKTDRLQIQLTFLVTASSSKPHEANDDLVRLAFAAMTKKEIEPDLTPLSTEEWRAFGAVPRPAFSFTIPLNVKVEKPGARRVEKPLVIESVSLNSPGNRLDPD